MNTSLNDSPRFVDPFWRWQKDNEGNWIKYNITLDDCHPIDLNKRTIDVPECLSVEKDHRAETIYFKVDRYFGFANGITGAIIRGDIYYDYQPLIRELLNT